MHNARLRINLKKLLLVLVTISFFILYLKCDKEPPIKPSGTGSVYGIVIDAQTDFPVTNAVVLASKNQVADTTDSLGTFALTELSIGQETLLITSEGYEDNIKVIEIKSDSVWIEIAINRIAENLYLYVGTAGGNDLFVVDVDSMQKVDSIYFAPGHIQDLSVTPGGTKLYITQGWPDSTVYYLNTKDRTYHLTTLPKGSIYFNENNDGFLFSDEGIFRLDTLSDQYEKIDTLTIKDFIKFKNSSSTFYFANYESKLYRYDYEQRKILDSIELPSAVIKEMTPDNCELYFTTPNGILGVINIQSRIVEYITYVNRLGRIAVTPDGEYVIVTDPGSNLGPSPGSGLLTVVRTSDHSLFGYIDVKIVSGDNPSTSKIVITSSGSYAFASNSYGGDLFIIDLKQRIAIKRLEFRPLGATIGPLVLGLKPKL